jgi:hypothetical protein
VTFTDAWGKKFLDAMHTEGAEFLTCGCLMRAVLAKITDTSVPDRECQESEGESEMAA